MAKRNIVVIGGSTGAFEAFKTVAAGLPADLDASVFIVWHMSPTIGSVLPQVLNRQGPLFATQARDGEKIVSGRIYVARPDHHLLIEDDTVRVTKGPKENRFRPAVDPLFRSAAYNYGPRVVGIVLSGALDDGMAGLWTIKHRGGTAIVQDPNEAQISSMPENAIREVDVDHILHVNDMAAMIARLARTNAEPALASDTAGEEIKERTLLEVNIAAETNALESGVMSWGALTPFTCPACSGVLSRVVEGGRPRFRCHTGHAYSADSLLSSLTENIEESLWSAIRGVDESIMLLNHLGDHFAEDNQGSRAAKFFQKAAEARLRNELIRQAVMDHEVLSSYGVEKEFGMPPPTEESEQRRNIATGGNGVT